MASDETERWLREQVGGALDTLKEGFNAQTAFIARHDERIKQIRKELDARAGVIDEFARYKAAQEQIIDGLRKEIDALKSAPVKTVAESDGNGGMKITERRGYWNSENLKYLLWLGIAAVVVIGLVVYVSKGGDPNNMPWPK